jgi:hypothetical protein
VYMDSVKAVHYKWFEFVTNQYNSLNVEHMSGGTICWQAT